MQPQQLNFFLKNRQQIDDCTNVLRQAGLMEHGLSCKNFDLAYIIPHIGNGNVLDMGSCGSFILYNLVKKGHQGEKIGIDLAYPDDYVLTWPPEHTVPTEGVHCFKADLMNPPFPDGKFQYITCLSVIEHEVDIDKLATECSRLLSPGGKLFLTFDYWDPKVNTDGKELFGLKWNIFDKEEVYNLIKIFNKHQLFLHCLSPYASAPAKDPFIDWSLQDAVINPAFCSPFDVAYTFGIFMFEKKPDLMKELSKS